MRLALSQFDATVGDLVTASDAIRRSARHAADAGADLLVLPELAILGYPPRDLLLRQEVVPACEAAVATLARDLPLPTLVGSPRRVEGGSRSIANSIALCRGGRIEAWHDKILLPTYDVFDEARWFEPGTTPMVFDLETDEGIRRVGVLVCEDLWHAGDVPVPGGYPVDPVRMLADRNCDLVVSPSASPFVAGKHHRHEELLGSAAELLNAPVAMVNQVGAHDDLVFDGGSMVVRPGGEKAGLLPRFEEGIAIVDVERDRVEASSRMSLVEERFHAIRRATADYVRRSGHAKVVLGLSGGIDSALVAAIATAALGPESVLGVLLPSRYSSEGSRVDARDTVDLMGIDSAEIGIEAIHAEVSRLLDPFLARDGNGLEGLADENVQARARGLLLMTISNARSHLLLSTSNKSEMAVGYSTLYGDMCGGLAPIGDLYKSEVFEMANWMNRHHERLGFRAPPVPESSITKPPSAELRPDQRDQDSLPPYDRLDSYLRERIEHGRAPSSLVGEGHLESDEADAVERLLAISEFKRYQATIVPKLTSRAFGRGRDLPIVARWRT